MSKMRESVKNDFLDLSILKNKVNKVHNLRQ